MIWRDQVGTWSRCAVRMRRNNGRELQLKQHLAGAQFRHTQNLAIFRTSCRLKGRIKLFCCWLTKTAYRWGGSLKVCNFTRELFVLLLIRDISCKLRFFCYVALSLENSTSFVTIKIALLPRAWRERKCAEKLCTFLLVLICSRRIIFTHYLPFGLDT